jgi:hypothetical protein
MVSRSLASALLMLVALHVFGCQPDCRLVCERIEEADCEGGADVPDCERQCKHEQDLVTNAECQDDYDAYLLCVDELEDMCDLVPVCEVGEPCRNPKCDSEFDDLVDCLQDYCIEHPRNNECEGQSTPPKA